MQYVVVLICGWEDKGADTGSRVTTTGVNQDREETAGSSRTEDRDTGIWDEGRVGHAGKITEIMFWGTAHGNPRLHEEPCRKGERSATEDTLVFKGEHCILYNS